MLLTGSTAANILQPSLGNDQSNILYYIYCNIYYTVLFLIKVVELVELIGQVRDLYVTTKPGCNMENITFTFCFIKSRGGGLANQPQKSPSDRSISTF